MFRDLKMLLGLTIGVGAFAYGLYRLTTDVLDQEEKLDTDVAIPFEDFRKDSVFVDEVNGQMLAGWIRSKKRPNDSVCIVAYPVKEMLDKFNITGCPANLDPDRNLLLFILDLETSQVQDTRLLSFCSMSDMVEKLFCGKKYFVLTENAQGQNR